MSSKTLPNGSAEAPIEVSSLPPVVGINFGNTYGEGLAECIANEDGERQITYAIAFQYIGNQAKSQLVKNSKNTITGFRNVLGKKYHPDIVDEPAYKVEILQPAPSPLPTSNVPSELNTPAASHAPTPRSEPIPAERILSVSEVTSIFIKSLIQCAEDFLGRKVQGAVISAPAWFSDTQRAALEKAASDAGVNILQLLDEAGAAAATTTTDLITFLAADFTKKTKTPFAVCPSTDIQDKRAEAKLRLAIEHTKWTISASPGANHCLSAVADSVIAVSASAAVDAHEVDEIAYVGGTMCLPGLDERICIGAGFNEEIETPFSRGTVAALISSICEDAELREAFTRDTKANHVRATTRMLGVLLPDPAAEKSDNKPWGVWVPVVQKETALSVCRTVSFDVALPEESKRFALEVSEVKDDIRVEKVQADRKTVANPVLLGALELEALLGIKAKGKGPQAGKRTTTIDVQFIVGIDGDLEVDVKEVSKDGASGEFRVPAH
ncbi:hypothetical protein K443DRAFT_680856 [Laccaria amethystina LaAM-08-1]|uniref:Actin-like ATPase domain-containing protein n=1 Tax=Laccaria amethystina LaAM-08-1 TaxID=1095629 RepID=A0A0C9XQN6_9AGAR|nr:hypothetical protein K443DRAFT_680856 [Laccaria amethystina LaAM-08-1]